MSEEEAAKQQAYRLGGNGTPTEDDVEEDPEDLLYLEDDEENHNPDHVHTHHHLGQRGSKVNRDSKRTLVSKGESGFVSENTLNSASNLQKRGKYFNFSSSSIFRRVLRLGPRNRNQEEGGGAGGVVIVPVQGSGPGRIQNSFSKQNTKSGKNSKKRKFGRGRRARRADLEAALLRSGQGIGNKSFLGSSSTVHQNNLGLRRAGVQNNSSGKSRVSSL